MYDIKRGDIFYVSKFGYQVGSEQHAGRPAVVISNDENNRHSETVEVVFCTTKPKTKLPTHVETFSTPQVSTVLCEQITSVSTDRLENYIGTCNDEEMEKIDLALQISIGLPRTNNIEKEAVPATASFEEKKVSGDYLAVVTERDTYKALYEGLLDRVMIMKNK